MPVAVDPASDTLPIAAQDGGLTKYACPQMGHSDHRLHLNHVHLVQGVIQNSWCIDDLKPKVFVIQMPHEKRFRRKRKRLDFDIGSRDTVDEGRLANAGWSQPSSLTYGDHVGNLLGETAHKESTGVRIDAGQPPKMLPNGVEIQQTVLQLLADSRHPTEGSNLCRLG